MVKYSVEFYKGKQEEEKLKENQNHIIFKNIHKGKGYGSIGIYKGTYIECLKQRKEEIIDE